DVVHLPYLYAFTINSLRNYDTSQYNLDQYIVNVIEKELATINPFVQDLY
ncbi:5497_t:CDS:2, partial [Diversispora eburnea]